MVPRDDAPASPTTATRVCRRPADCPYATRRRHRGAAWLRDQLAELLPGDPALAAEIACLFAASTVTDRCLGQTDDECGGEEMRRRRRSAAAAATASD